MAPRCSRYRWWCSCQDGQHWVQLQGCGLTSWCASGPEKSAPGWRCDLCWTIHKKSCVSSVITCMHWSLQHVLKNCNSPQCCVYHKEKATWCWAVNFHRWKTSCLLETWASPRIFSQPDPLPTGPPWPWFGHKRQPVPILATKNLDFSICKTKHEWKDNLWGWAQKCCQTLRVKVCFTYGFLSWFQGEFRICQNKNTVIERFV